MLYFLDSWNEASKKRSDLDFSRMLIVVSLGPTLTDELLKVNSALKLIFSVTEDQCSGGQWSSKWGRRHFRTSSRYLAKKTAERLPISSSFTVFYSCLKPVLFCTTSKLLSASETTTNNQEVKRSWYRLQNVNNLAKDYIRMCVTCRSFNFIGHV